MLVLALDTATAAVIAGVVELADVELTDVAPAERGPLSRPGRDRTAGGAGVRCLARSAEISPRGHGERLAPAVARVLDEAALTPDRLDAVVVGLGPGPFTSLRVGVATAAALGHALDRPAHGVCTHDAIAHAAGIAGPVAVVADARRREVHWSLYDAAGVRHRGPEVGPPAGLAEVLATDPVVALASPGPLPFPEAFPGADRVAALPEPASLVAIMAAALRSGVRPGPLVPLYLRRPDAVPPGAPKPVTPREPVASP